MPRPLISLNAGASVWASVGGSILGLSGWVGGYSFPGIRGQGRGWCHLIMCSSSSAVGSQSIWSPYDALAPIQLPGESHTAIFYCHPLFWERRKHKEIKWLCGLHLLCAIGRTSWLCGPPCSFASPRAFRAGLRLVFIFLIQPNSVSPWAALHPMLRQGKSEGRCVTLYSLWIAQRPIWCPPSEG